MNRMRTWLAISALLAAIPAAAAAQATAGAQPAGPAPERVQRSFVYLGHDLRVTVLGDAGGTIQVVRGEDGRLDLSGRVVGGLASVAMADDTRSELTLTSSGASRIDWVLIVPTDVRVSLRSPGQPEAGLGPLPPPPPGAGPRSARPSRRCPTPAPTFIAALMAAITSGIPKGTSATTMRPSLKAISTSPPRSPVSPATFQG